MTRNFYFGIAILLLLTACFNNKDKTTDDTDTTTQQDAIYQASKDTLDLQQTVRQVSKEILGLIKHKKYDSLATYFHPKKGVRFSPYAYIDTKKDIRLTPQAFITGMHNDKTFNWGAYDGTGDPIALTIHQYLEKFVYDVDFSNPETLTVNGSSSTGNTINNLEKIYPGNPYIESYFSGFEKKYQGMDWKALRLVYEKYDGRYYLVAIIHDQWTV